VDALQHDGEGVRRLVATATDNADAAHLYGGATHMLNQTGGNRFGPVSVWAGMKSAQIQNSNLN